MRATPILLAVLAASFLLVGAAGSVAAHEDHGHDEEDDTGGFTDRIVGFFGDIVDAIAGALGGDPPSNVASTLDPAFER